MTRVPVRERILSTANELFRYQGFPNTGINQVIAESGAAKASFYQYFPSKDDLGRACLRDYSAGQLSMIGRLLDRSPDPREFIVSWVRLLKREARQGVMYGCPIANFKAQIGAADGSFDDVIAEITSDTIEMLSAYLRRAHASGFIRSQEKDDVLARRIFAAYHGVLQTWRLTGDVSAFDELEPMFLSLTGLRR
ncbi:MAG: TetR/AcrR family transcriptional regulator [Spirochaetia bacterium]|nr:TetR/AcrR family transcriptional regulator [Spirochaetia bacterium]